MVTFDKTPALLCFHLLLPVNSYFEFTLLLQWKFLAKIVVSMSAVQLWSLLHPRLISAGKCPSVVPKTWLPRLPTSSSHLLSQLCQLPVLLRWSGIILSYVFYTFNLITLVEGSHPHTDTSCCALCTSSLNHHIDNCILLTKESTEARFPLYQVKVTVSETSY